MTTELGNANIFSQARSTETQHLRFRRRGRPDHRSSRSFRRDRANL